ncbi:TetR/AcrR family transcriptional regulator [Tsukamurella sp. 8F]|uniref:TetR/AcrR family transcriptional regulator n=1 Tax=unclassified Tsukamurella TaxID=2633480 RepID=UPI0023BA0DB2|nr:MULTISPECIES: TetR/AcrR family transcriptional regulator [unclassified Tsukamurella]MDF0529183.1 TetR/AcrR family transcriptional regulator [Tsukamurella sp. 8J]MDF0585368.1 TetR/AcrR family transcriptional regulator [Tsukamurella sp. 8F]
MATDTRDRLLDATEQILLGAGTASLTLDAVAAEAGVSKGGLLYHFKSKDALLLGVVDRLSQRWNADIGDSVARWYLAAPEGDEAREAQMLTSIAAALRTADRRDDEVHAAVCHLNRQWDDAIRSEVPDPVTAETVRLVGDGLLLAAMLGLPMPEPDLYKQVVARLLDPEEDTTGRA